MFRLLRMDLRRLCRTRSFYIILGVTVGLIALMVTMVSAVADPGKRAALEDSGVVVVSGASDEEMLEEIRSMSRLDFTYECLSSSFLLPLVCMGVSLFVQGDFASGYIKNICFSHPRRWQYVLSKLLVTGVYSAVVTVLGVVLSAVLPLVFGLPLAPSPLVGFLRYTFWLWLPTWAFGLMGLALTLLTRTATLGIVLAVPGSGLTAMLVQNLCGRFGWPDLSRYMLSSVVTGQCVPGATAAQCGMVLACAVGWAAVYAAGGFGAMEKRDI